MPELPPRATYKKPSNIPKAKGMRFDVIGKDDPRTLHQWEKLRNSYRQCNPLCQRCKYLNQLDKYSSNNMSVHHIRPLFSAKDKEELHSICFDTDNLLTLCGSCHSYFSQLERTGDRKDLMRSIREGLEIKLFDNKGS